MIHLIMDKKKKKKKEKGPGAQPYSWFILLNAIPSPGQT
jgi:hypothetical protein